jgi:YggT family protein
MSIAQQIITWFLHLYSLVLIARVLITWIDPMMGTPAARVLLHLTEPVLAPIRRVLPQTGAIDLSPVVAVLLIEALIQVIVRI